MSSPRSVQRSTSDLKYILPLSVSDCYEKGLRVHAFFVSFCVRSLWCALCTLSVVCRLYVLCIKPVPVLPLFQFVCPFTMLYYALFVCFCFAVPALCCSSCRVYSPYEG